MEQKPPPSVEEILLEVERTSVAEMFRATETQRARLARLNEHISKEPAPDAQR